MSDSLQPFDSPTNTDDDPRVPNTGTGLDLTTFDEDFQQAAPIDRDGVPDGRYQVRVNTVRLGESQKGAPMLKWDLVVISGPHAGRHIFKNAVISSASLPFVKTDLEMLGLKLARFSDLPNHLDSLLDQTVELSKRTKGEYANVYFDRLIKIPPPANGQTVDMPTGAAVPF